MIVQHIFTLKHKKACVYPKHLLLRRMLICKQTISEKYVFSTSAKTQKFWKATNGIYVLRLDW